MNKDNVSYEIPEPVLLNCWKHHAGFIKWKIREYKGDFEVSSVSLRKEILLIGGSIMDLYLGGLTPSGIAGSTMDFLRRMKVSDVKNFQRWVSSDGNDYREIVMEDQSKWTLRAGEMKSRYIHIHPSRYSPHTIRVRSSSLKSAILFCAISFPEPGESLDKLNLIRKQYLDLPPLKNINSESAIFKLVKIFS